MTGIILVFSAVVIGGVVYFASRPSNRRPDCVEACCPVFCANSTDVPTCVLTCGTDYCLARAESLQEIVCAGVEASQRVTPPPLGNQSLSDVTSF